MDDDLRIGHMKDGKFHEGPPKKPERIDHVHCQECFHPIYRDQEAHTGQQVVMAPGPTGLQPMPRPVPVCQTCWQLIKAEQVKPKLIVPKHNGG